jgi:hypothetical protein
MDSRPITWKILSLINIILVTLNQEQALDVLRTSHLIKN